MSRTLVRQRGARALSGREMRVCVDAGTRWAWQLEDSLAAVYEEQIKAVYDQAAKLLLRVPRGLAAAAPPAGWTIPDPDELGLSLREQMDDRHARRQAGDDASEAIRVEAIRRVTEAGLQAMGVSLSVRNPLVEGVLRDQLGGKIVGIRHTTRQAIMGSLESSWKAGDSIPRAAAALRAAAPGIAASRSRTIARTEMLAAVNGGAHALASLSNETGAQDGQPPLLKIWLTAQDEAVRDTHVEAGDAYGAGSGIPMSDPFEVGDSQLQFPGDPDGSAEEVINCRCAISYEEADDPAPASTSDVVEQAIADTPAGGGGGALSTLTSEIFSRAQADVLAGERGGDAAEYAAWRAYSHGSYLDMNAEARGAAPADWPPARRAEAKARNEALGRLLDSGPTLDSDVTVYRGLDASGLAGDVRTGEVISDPAFLSTSATPDEAERIARRAHDGVVLRLRAPAGERFLPGSQVGEHELIFKPGSRVRVLDEVPTSESYRVFNAELEPPPDALAALRSTSTEDLLAQIAREQSGRPAEPLPKPSAPRAAETPDEMQARMDREGAEEAALQRALQDAAAQRHAERRAAAIAATPDGSRVLVDSAGEYWNADQLRGMFDTPALERLGLDVQASSVDEGLDQAVVHAFVGTESGEPVAEIQRSIDLRAGTVHHDSFFIEPPWQGKGLAKDFLRSSVLEYDTAGIERVTVNAAGVNGRYTWARFGFDFQHADDVVGERKLFYRRLFAHAQSAGLDVGERPTDASITAKLREAYPQTMARIDAAEHSWEFAGMSIDENGVVVEDFGKQAMISGPSWSGVLELDPASASRKVFDDYTA